MGTMRESKNIVGAKVAKLRNAQGLSQDKLAAKCQRAGWDIDRNTIAKIEGGRRCVTDREILKIAKALSVNLTALFPC